MPSWWWRRSRRKPARSPRPGPALRAANAKFTRRFHHIESALGPRLGLAGLAEMEALWQEAKQAEKSAS